MNRKIGYFLSHEQFSPADLVGGAVAAEEAGFDSVWASDHFHPWQENQGHAGNAWLTLAAAGQRTSRVLLGTAVTCPIYRNRPALVAQAFATLGVLYPGRVFLGVGTGEAVNELPAGGGWGPYSERLALLREAVELIRKLWEEERVTHEGSGFSITNAKIYDKPSTPIPIYIAASGPRSAALAGEAGNGWITNSETLLEAPDVVRAFREGVAARDAGASAMEILVEQYVFVGSEEEAYAAAPLWRFAPAFPLVVDMDDPRAIQRTAEQNVTLDDVVAPWLISVDPAEHVEQVNRLFKAGATHVAIHSVQPDQRRLIEFYGSDVLPALRVR
ncbi:MAG: TIGR03557 family F420-dependent LLM class oxidoreductase [Chloroflexi bacterium]|nr:TIGR03557 family F420-dependent LLM class oxidoreductase [Chloroflexota bacterium]